MDVYSTHANHSESTSTDPLNIVGHGYKCPRLINTNMTCLDRFGGAESSWTPQMSDLCWGIDILNLRVTFLM